MTEAVAPRPGDEPDRPGRLLELAVVDLALIERLRLPLSEGLNVITGETGAGKSLVIDSLGLALGARADTTLVRHGAEVARVEAVFDRLPEPLIAAREVSLTGRSTARLDDETVTAGRLNGVVGGLVEIHGQHEQQRLLDPGRQRDLLDAYGGHAAGRQAVETAVARWRVNRAALAELSVDPRELARRLEVLEHEAAEIAAARLRAGEAEEIQARLEAAQHGEAIARGAATASESLAGEAGGARDGVGLAARELRALARLDGRWAAMAERVGGLEAELADAASEVRDLAETVDHDPAELRRLDERLGLIHSLQRRFGDDEAAVIAHAERATAEAERLRGVDGERARRQADEERLLADVALRCAELNALRRSAAVRLGSAVEGVLVELGFPAGVFHVDLGHRPAGRDQPAIELDGDAVAFDASGADEVVFRLAPNPGEPARALARIASGGELSRVALAIKQVLAEADRTPVLVFDEVDTGIGGRSADPVGRSLWALGRRHQVLCVTHLPQIAAHADAHYRIAKREREGRTMTDIVRLDREGRIVELAHMLGGVGEAGVAAAALAQARELLDRAETWRTRAAR